MRDTPVRDPGFSDDGYIVEQGLLAELRYGRFGSDYNGCGWIAAYNLLRALGLPALPNDIREELSMRLRFGGRFGTGVFLLQAFLRERGVSTRMRLVFRKSAAADIDSGILMYLTRGGLHFAAFTRCGGAFRFFNAACRTQPHIEPLGALLSREAVLGLAVCLSVE